jgi:hypothetical protein
VFLAAKEDYEGGYIFNLKAALTGEIFFDFIAAAQAALDDGYKDVAAVLACAALEDKSRLTAREREKKTDLSFSFLVRKRIMRI